MMLTGKDLIADIDSCDVKTEQVGIWWLGQHSFVVKLGRKVVYIDPFLTPMARRQVPPLLSPQDVTNATLICGTHDHVDHIDREVWPAMAKASPSAKFVVPDLLREGLTTGLQTSQPSPNWRFSTSLKPPSPMPASYTCPLWPA